jgi:hypothetical protein
MKTALVKLKGKAGYACKIYIGGRHVATVAHPDRPGEAGARQAAYDWDQKYRKHVVKE